MIPHQRGLVQMSLRSLTILKRSSQIPHLNNRRCFVTILNPSAPKIVKIRSSAKTPVLEKEPEKVVLLRKSLEESNAAAEPIIKVPEPVIKVQDNVEESNVPTDTFSKIRTNFEEPEFKESSSSERLKEDTAAAEESFKEESKADPSVKHEMVSSLETIELSNDGISSTHEEKEAEATVEQINGSSADDSTKISEEHINVSQSEDEKVHKVVEETFPESKEEQSLVQSSDDIKEELKKSDVNVESVEAQNPRPEENVIKEKLKVLTKRGKKKTKEPLKEAAIEDEAEDSSSSSSSSASSSSDSSSDSEDESANNVSNLGRSRLDQEPPTTPEPLLDLSKLRKVKPHVPLVKFNRKSSYHPEPTLHSRLNLAFNEAQAASILPTNTLEPPKQLSTASTGANYNVYEWFERPVRFARSSLDQTEVDQVNSGGAEKIFQ